MDSSRIFIVGANGQLGTALRTKYPDARTADISELDITDKTSVESYDWSAIDIIINAAAYTNVDGAETNEGRVASWNVNASAVANFASVANAHNCTLVHISSDYVFDGSNSPHTETEPLSPLNVYGQSKAAGDIAASFTKQHYILRTTWVIGEGKNFVRTMLSLAERGISPIVVDDQVGRLTFTSELVRAIDHLLTTGAPYGVYNTTNSGNSASWADITRVIFKTAGHTELTVTGISTADYYADKPGIAPRPLQSTMDLTKLQSTGFQSRDWADDLSSYITAES